MDASFWGAMIGTTIGSAVASYRAAKGVGERVVAGTAAQSTSNEIQVDVKEMKKKIEVLEKIAEAKGEMDLLHLDNRSPK